MMRTIYSDPKAREHMSNVKKEQYKGESGDELRIKRLNTLGQNKPFDVFKTDGSFIGTFTYQYKAIRYLNDNYDINSDNLSKHICSVLKGKRKSCSGFTFKYKT
jgi:hypothetical protein